MKGGVKQARPERGGRPAFSEEDPLKGSVQYLRGAGPARASLLAKLGIETIEDLLWYLPRDVVDLTHVRAVRDLREGELQTIRGSVVDIDGRQASNGRVVTAVLLDCGGEYARGIWFNQPWMLRKFQPGDTVLFSAKPKRRAGRWEFAHPQVQWIEEDDRTAHGGLLPRYGLTEGLTVHDMRRLTRTAVEEYAEFVPEHLPDEFLASRKLPRLCDAIRQIHVPATIDEYAAARRRLLFDDLFEFQLGLALRRRAWRRQQQAPVLPTTAKIDARIRRLFPFTFTKGQDQAVREIAADLASGRAMHRLLQADVGAGKTAVAVYAMLVAIAAGHQAVLMAPTEVLALQHWATVDSSLAHSRVERCLLTGNLTAAARKRALARIAGGEVQLIVGTQAVIQKDVKFNKLGIAVIDEQHKFGVVQRARFSGQDVSPHVLVMTATPIPRSLCLTQFGDLDITAISELPPGRQRVVTSRVVGSQARRRAWEFLRKQLHTGRQAYIVCPLVEGDEDSLTRAVFDNDGPLPESAEDVYRQLRDGELKDFRVGIVHGQMDRRQKAEAMEAFRNGDIQALVSTTVVEVGVDVPNATLMVVNQAHRFGLSQLHQLRGRVSRGRHQGYCFLFSDSESADAQSRLQALEETTDGFRIAEVDFELRGPGDVLGTRQHGQLPLKVADLRRDQAILNEAREAAFALVDSGEFDQPPFAPAKRRVLDRFGRLMDLPQTG